MYVSIVCMYIRIVCTYVCMYVCTMYVCMYMSMYVHVITPPVCCGGGGGGGQIYSIISILYIYMSHSYWQSLVIAV